MTLKDLYTNTTNLTDLISYLDGLINHYAINLEVSHYEDIPLDEFCETLEGMGEYSVKHVLACLFNAQTGDPADHLQECLYDLGAPSLIWKEMLQQFHPSINSCNSTPSTFIEDVCQSMDELLPLKLYSYWHKQISDVFSQWLDSHRDDLEESRRKESTRLDTMYRIGFATGLQKQGSNNE
tara:strand:+ start:939 stop:1481 length:543 start_codon:yes stop_codon:yes gene_type:complete